jgi:hypothetical protein
MNAKPNPFATLKITVLFVVCLLPLLFAEPQNSKTGSVRAPQSKTQNTEFAVSPGRALSLLASRE